MHDLPIETYQAAFQAIIVAACGRGGKYSFFKVLFFMVFLNQKISKGRIFLFF